MVSLRVGVLLALVVGCSTVEDAPPERVTVDAEDRFCDPVDDMEDDEASPETPPATPLTRWVNPLIGTGGIAWGTGSAYPGPQVPFGMAKPGPDTSRLSSSMEF